MVWLESADLASDLKLELAYREVRLGCLLVELEDVVAVWLVIWLGSLVAVYTHWSVSLTVVDSGSVRAVDWDLVVVGTKSVSVGVVVRKKSALEHLIETRLNTRNSVGWCKS